MQHVKRGNPRRPKKTRRQAQRISKTQPLEAARLSLHEIDLITGNENTLYTLFYEMYRGYTIYSTERGLCCIHGRDGCLRIQGKYVCFPDIEQAKNLIKHFQVHGHTSQESMNRSVPENEYICLNRQRNKQPVRYSEEATMKRQWQTY